MEHIEIREVMPEDAEALIACMKKTGGETDNLTFGEEGVSGDGRTGEGISGADAPCGKVRPLRGVERRRNDRERQFEWTAAQDEPCRRDGPGGSKSSVE